MDSEIQARSVEESQRRDALVGRFLQSVLEAQDLFHIYLGSQLGLYAALRALDWATAADLAEATRLSERSVREWLVQQAEERSAEWERPFHTGNSMVVRKYVHV